MYRVTMTNVGAVGPFSVLHASANGALAARNTTPLLSQPKTLSSSDVDKADKHKPVPFLRVP